MDLPTQIKRRSAGDKPMSNCYHIGQHLPFMLAERHLWEAKLRLARLIVLRPRDRMPTATPRNGVARSGVSFHPFSTAHHLEFDSQLKGHPMPL